MSGKMPVSALYLTASGKVTNEACLVYGFVLSARDGDKAAYVYDAREEDAGQLRFALRPREKTTLPVLFPCPVTFHRGLYVKFDGDTNEVTVLWAPIPMIE